MRGQSFFDRLKQQFGDKITGSNFDAIDPWIEVSPAGLWKCARILRDEPESAIQYAAIASPRSIISSRTPKKPPKYLAAAHGTGLSLVERAASRVAGVQGDAAALEERRGRRVARGAHGEPHLAHGRLARARSIRSVGRATSSAIRTCGGFCAPKIGSAIRCAKTTKCRWNITAFAGTINSRSDETLTDMATHVHTDDPRIIEFDVRTDEMLVNMGPQHPSTHGVLRLVLRTDGEIVSEMTPHIGYLHRCAEKIGENLTPRQWIPYTDRMDYLAGMNMNLGWALTVEKLLSSTCPKRPGICE